MNNLEANNIKKVSFYEFLEVSGDFFIKGKELISIKHEGKINDFIRNAWGDLTFFTEKPFGKTYILEIKTIDGSINFYLKVSKGNSFIKLFPLGKSNKIITRMNTAFKSYKLYKYLDVLEKKEKELIKNRDK